MMRELRAHSIRKVGIIKARLGGNSIDSFKEGSGQFIPALPDLLNLTLGLPGTHTILIQEFAPQR